MEQLFFYDNLKVSFLTLPLLFLQFSLSNVFCERSDPVKDNSKILNYITGMRIRFDLLFKTVEERTDLMIPCLEEK